MNSPPAVTVVTEQLDHPGFDRPGSDAPGSHGMVVSVAGEVDAHTAPPVREAVLATVGPGARVVVDLTEVTFLDSTGLGVFVTALKRLREVDGTLDVVITSPRVLKVFTLTGLDVLIPIHETLAAAVEG